MKNKIWYLKRTFVLAMACIMPISMAPATVFAAEDDVAVESVQDMETQDTNGEIAEDTDVESVGEENAEYKYVYAGLTWEEYWASEGIYLAEGSAWDTSSAETDSKGETDKGAYDAVSRATTNHGLHRGSFQCDAVIYDTDGNTYEVAGWTSDSPANMILKDGTIIGFSKGTITYEENGEQKSATMDHYEVKGIKYVPVAVKTSDYNGFCQKYDVVENDGTVFGGYSENQLSSYSKTAEVTADTNGLKTAVNDGNGNFSFTARTTGADSGLKEETQKSVDSDKIIVTVKNADGSYGEFLRVDLTGDAYGDLGSNMYAVRWDYYGDDSTYAAKLASYGTKFAADNWMHKVNGIQLGLTDSLRCQLPAGTTGAGYWELTVYAMGYADYTFRIQATDDNIVKAGETEIVTTALEAAVTRAKALNESDYTAESWTNLQTELKEAEDELAAPHSQAAVNEAISHLTQAIGALVKVDTTIVELSVPKAKAASASYNSIKVTWNKVTNATGYIVSRSTSKNGTYTDIKTIAKADATSYTNTKVTTGKTYYYKVRAYVTANEVTTQGDNSAAVSTRATLAKAKVTSARNNKKKQVLVKWNKVAGASGYEIVRSTKKNGKYKKVAIVKSGSKVSYINKKLSKKTYYYKVRAYRTVNGKKVYGAYCAAKKVKVTK